MANVTGTDGNDQGAGALTGTQGADIIDGGSGGDELRGGRGADQLSGGEGADMIRGGAGRDQLFGFGAGDQSGAAGAITVERIETNVSQLVFAATAPGDDEAFYLLAKDEGRIIRFDPQTGASTEFLQIPDGVILAGGEQGLLGLAFHPDYDANGRFFINIVNANGDVEIQEYARSDTNPLQGDPTSGQTVLIEPHPGFTNHNGGTVAFGPDGFLYISVGDGGGGGDPGENAQDVSNLLGTILRIDINGDDFPGNDARNYAIPSDNPFASGGGAPEIFDFGLRNPFRFTFDAETGDLVIGDVGQNAREEINLHPADTPGGLNFGWDILEGTMPFEPGQPGEPQPGDPALTNPIVEIEHPEARSITGGVFIEAEGGLQGAYIFADFVTGLLRTFRIVDGEVVDLADRVGQLSGDDAPRLVAAFANGPDGELYAVSLDGSLSRLSIGDAAGDGGDTLSGGRGADALFGGIGDDLLIGGRGADQAKAGLGDDEVRGGKGRDQLKGQAGDDLILGGKGADTLRGGQGADTLNGGNGADLMFGGAGADVFRFALAAGNDEIRGFQTGRDQLDLSAFDLDSFDDLTGAFAELVADTRIDLGVLGGAGSITLAGLTPGSLSAEDVIL